MSVAEFESHPFQQDHLSYQKSALEFPAAPEWTTGEVMLASTCRVLGLAGANTDRTVDLELIPQLPNQLTSKNVLGAPLLLWDRLFGDAGCIRSPALPRSRFPNLSPTVPFLAAHGGVLGALRGRWTPGNFIMACIASGAGQAGYEALLPEFAQALDVGSEDDVFARFLQEALTAVPPPKSERPRPPAFGEWKHVARRQNRKEPLSPAERFVDDLPQVLRLKLTLSREQWVAVLEAELRLAAVTQVLWLCRLNANCWSLSLDALGDGSIPTESEVEAILFESHHGSGAFLEVGRDTERAFSITLEGYVRARLGLNLILHRLDDANVGWPTPLGSSDSSSCATQIVNFLQHLRRERFNLAPNPKAWVQERCEKLVDRNSRAAAGKKGPPKNIREFLRYVTRQVAPLDQAQRSYDQAYLAPSTLPRQRIWPLQPGPNLLLVVVHCVCSARPGVPSTIDDLRKHLAAYGIRIASEELESGRLIGNLAALGLTIDSPDAYGGRVLVDPFNSPREQSHR